MKRQKSEIISFKADRDLLESLQGIPNRSEFIRIAVLSALDNACPLCRGTGALTPAQKIHWNSVAERHALSECDECHELRLVCANEAAEAPAPSEDAGEAQG